MIVASLGAGISTTGQKSAELDISRTKKELISVHFELAGTQTAWTAALEGRWWNPEYSLTVTDETDANLAAFFAGELLTAAHGSALAVGQKFKVLGTGDTTDNALQTAKGSAPAAGDIFMISNTGTPAVVYIPNEGFVTIVSKTQASGRISHIQEAMVLRVQTSGTWTASTIVGVHVQY